MERERWTLSAGVGGRDGESDCCCLVPWTCRTMFTMLPGLEERVMTVVTPADVARRAATILVDMPPVPRFEPAVETSASRVEMSSTTSIACASGFVRGFLS